MAAPVTANYQLPLSVLGHVQLQNTVRNGFTLIDAAIKALDTRVDAIELGLGTTDSNSRFLDAP